MPTQLLAPVSHTILGGMLRAARCSSPLAMHGRVLHGVTESLNLARKFKIPFCHAPNCFWYQNGFRWRLSQHVPGHDSKACCACPAGRSRAAMKRKGGRPAKASDKAVKRRRMVGGVLKHIGTAAPGQQCTHCGTQVCSA